MQVRVTTQFTVILPVVLVVLSILITFPIYFHDIDPTRYTSSMTVSFFPDTRA